MTEFVINALVVLVAILLWLILVALLVRPFGIRLPLQPLANRKSALQALTFSQYVFIGGVLHFGCGIAVVTAVSRYVSWKYFHGQPLMVTTGDFFNDFAPAVLAGVVFGLVSYGDAAAKG